MRISAGLRMVMIVRTVIVTNETLKCLSIS
jgi:hypothetical protein